MWSLRGELWSVVDLLVLDLNLSLGIGLSWLEDVAHPLMSICFSLHVKLALLAMRSGVPERFSPWPVDKISVHAECPRLDDRNMEDCKRLAQADHGVGLIVGMGTLIGNRTVCIAAHKGRHVNRIWGNFCIFRELLYPMEESQGNS